MNTQKHPQEELLPPIASSITAVGSHTLVISAERAEARRDAWLFVLVGLIVYGLSIDYRLLGDAVLYADFMQLAKFDDVTLHNGYYLLGFGLDRSVGAALGVPIEVTLAWLNVIAGAAALGVAYLLARHLLGGRLEALLAVGIYAFSGRVLANATSSEIYMVQTLLVLASFLCFVRGQVVGAGVLAGLSLHISPLSALAFLFFPVHDYQQHGRLRWRTLFLLGAVSLGVYAPYLFAHGKELLWGRRGLLMINGTKEADLLDGLLQFVKYQVKLFSLMLALAVPLFWRLRANARLIVLSLSVGLPHLYIIVKLRSEDNVFILNTDFFLAACLAIGAGVLVRSGYRVLAIAPIAAHFLLLTASRQIFQMDPHANAQQDLREVARTYAVGQPSVIITDWNHTMLLANYGRDAVRGPIERDPLFRQMVDIDLYDVRVQGPLIAEKIYVLDAWEPGGLVALFSSPSWRAERASENSIARLAERKFGLACKPREQVPYRMFECIRRS